MIHWTFITASKSAEPVMRLTIFKYCTYIYYLIMTLPQVYVFGGHDENDNYLTDGFSYQPLQNITGNVSNLPSARSHFAAGSISNTTIILAGGYSSEANENNNLPENCSLIYNVSADSWASGPCLKQGRGSACGSVCPLHKEIIVKGNFQSTVSKHRMAAVASDAFHVELRQGICRA